VDRSTDLSIAPEQLARAEVTDTPSDDTSGHAERPMAPARRRLLVTAGIAIAAAALWSLWAEGRRGAGLPSEADFQAAAKYLTEHRQEGDLVVVAPEWLVPASHPALAAVLPTVTLHDPEEERHPGHPRWWLVAPIEAPRFSLARTRRQLGDRGEAGQGVRRGRLWLQPFVVEADPVEDRLTERLARARVHVDAQPVRDCLPGVDGTHRCPPSPLEPEVVREVQTAWVDVQGRPMRCMRAAPAIDGPLVLTFGDVTAGQRLELRTALEGRSAYDDAAAPVELTVSFAGRELGRVRHLVAPGAVDHVLPIVGRPGERGELELRIASGGGAMARFCLDAWTAR